MKWFTSDQHFGHVNVIKYCNRPFKDVDEMNQELVRRHNAVVAPDDEVFHLGDFSLSKAQVGLYLPQLNGKHTLVMGNHDHCHMACAKNVNRQSRMVGEYHRMGFQEIMASGQLNIDGQQVILNHLPYSGDNVGMPERYQQYRSPNNGLWLLHGHVHTAWKQRDRMINVGVDQWDFTPVSITEIIELIRKGPV